MLEHPITLRRKAKARSLRRCSLCGRVGRHRGDPFGKPTFTYHCPRPLIRSLHIVYGLVHPRSNEILYVGRSSSGLRHPHTRLTGDRSNYHVVVIEQTSRQELRERMLYWSSRYLHRKYSKLREDLDQMYLKKFGIVR